MGSTKAPFDEKAFVKDVIKKAIQNGVNQKEIAALTGLSKGYVSKLWKRLFRYWKLETIAKKREKAMFIAS